MLSIGYSALFSDKPGLTRVVAYEIDCGDSPPINASPYRYDKAKDLIIKAHIDEMLLSTIIKAVDSPWHSPVVLCRKKEDLPRTNPKEWRFLIDYRALNSVTKIPVYPMPLIDDILHCLKSVKYMSSLDLTTGYNQVAMSLSDLKNTAFVIRHGTYAFQRLSFGLNGAPSVFQKLMVSVLKPVLGDNTLLYLDGILITAETF